MIRFFKQLYLNDRLFYVLGTCVVLFFSAYAFAPVFWFAIGLLLLSTLLTGLDVFLLFRRSTVLARREVAQVLSLHDTNPVTVYIENRSNQTLRLRLYDELPYQFNRGDFFSKQSLAPGAAIHLRYDLRPVQRGEYAFGNLHLYANTLLGLVSKKESFAAEKKVAVYPSIQQMGRQELAAIQHPSFVQGENKNHRLGQSYEFDQIKQYLPGDDPRHINWKASSTLGEVMINSYEDERSQQVYSLIDKSRVMKMPFNGLTLMDYAINSSLAFSNIVLKKQDKAGLLIFSSGVSTLLKAGRGPLQLKKLLYCLYKEKYDYAEANYEAVYTTVRRNIPNRSLLFLYTNFDSIYALERNIPVLRLLNKNHLLVVVFFENAELETWSKSEAQSLLDIYQLTIAKKLLLEKKQIYKELQKHGIQAIQCPPEQLSTATINKYLELKAKGMI